MLRMVPHAADGHLLNGEDRTLCVGADSARGTALAASVRARGGK
jgi:hypothetical protein